MADYLNSGQKMFAETNVRQLSGVVLHLFQTIAFKSANYQISLFKRQFNILLKSEPFQHRQFI